MLTKIVELSELESKSALEAEKNTATGLQNIINVSKLIDSDDIWDKKELDIMDLSLEHLEFYAEVMKGYLSLPPHHWVREKFPDGPGIVREFENIRIYIMRKGLRRMFVLLDSISSVSGDVREIILGCEYLSEKYSYLPESTKRRIGHDQRQILDTVAKIKGHFTASEQYAH